MNRFDVFKKNFKWVYIHFNGSYDFNNDPELFADTMTAYYETSKRLPTDKIYEFCQYIAGQEKWPLIAQWYELLGRFVTEPDLPTPKEEKTAKELLEVKLQNDIITGFWPLFGTLEGRTMVARVYAWYCQQHKLDLPNYWKQHLVYTPMPALKADYFDMKPMTRQELRIMGEMIDEKAKKIKVPGFRKLGQIVFGGLIPESKRRKY